MANIFHISNKLDGSSRILASAEGGNPFALWKMGNLAFTRGDYAEASRWYRQSANLGCYLGHRSLGLALQSGIGVLQNSVDALDHFIEATRLGDGESMYQAGRCFLYGIGCPPSLNQAIHYFHMAVFANEHCEAEALLAYVRATGSAPILGSKQDALATLISRSQEGDILATHAIGLWWLNGYLGIKDFGKSLSAFCFSADKSCVESLYQLGQMNFYGLGVPIDSGEALKFFKAASDCGHARASTMAGQILINGSQGTEPDISTSKRYLVKGRDLGDPGALVLLAKAKLLRNPTPQDFQEISLLLNQAKNLGFTGAADELLTLYSGNTNQFPMTDLRVYNGILSCASGGNVYAMLDLANHHFYGENSNPTEGLFWLQAAVDEGDINARFGLGVELIKISPSMYWAEGITYLKSASTLGSPYASLHLGHLYFAEGPKQNKSLAARYFRQAAEANIQDGQQALAYILFYGDGIPQDRDEAGYWSYLAKPSKPPIENQSCEVIALKPAGMDTP